MVLTSDNPHKLQRVHEAPRGARIDLPVELASDAKAATEELAAANAALRAEVAERKQAEAALRDLEARFRSVLENSLDAAYRRNLQTDSYDYMSPVIERITGYTAAEMTDPDFTEVLARIHPDDLPEVEAVIARTFAEANERGRAAASIEYRFRRKDGRDIWVADDFVVLAGEDGIPLFRLGNVQDVTESKRRTMELEALLGVSESLRSTLELPGLLTALVEQLHSVIEFDGLAIYLLEGEHLTVTEYVGPMPRHEALAISLPLAETAGCRQVIQLQRPVRIPDLQADTAEACALRTAVGGLQAALIGDCRSWLGLPLMAKGQAIGILRLSHAKPHHFCDDQMRLAAAVADHAALAIENSRLYERAQQIAALEERQRLARELHDSVSQSLYGIGLAAHATLRHIGRNSEKAENAVRHILSLAQTGLSDMRALILELRPEVLAQEGLARAIAKQAEALYQRCGVPITVDVGDEPDVPVDVQEALYRITQEAMMNAAKHALAKRINVSIGRDGRRMRLEIADDGIGFDPRANYPGHLGLRSMSERATRIGAKFTVHSKPGAGSLVRVEVSLPARGVTGLN